MTEISIVTRIPQCFSLPYHTVKENVTVLHDSRMWHEEHDPEIGGIFQRLHSTRVLRRKIINYDVTSWYVTSF